jgi:hypothetical protein
MAVLALQQDARLAAAFLDGQNDHRTRMAYDVAAGADASGFENLVGGNAKNRAAENLTGRKHVGFRFARWVRHAHHTK